jgi:hypothetical protein
MVMTVAADGTVVPKAVETGEPQNGLRSGLVPTDLVIIDCLVRPRPTKRTTVAEAAHAQNEEQLGAVRKRLMGLEPAQFEHFVKELLDAMDYEDVSVTKLSGDKGVDVVHCRITRPFGGPSLALADSPKGPRKARFSSGQLRSL